MAPRSKKSGIKSTTSSKAKATKKRALPQEEENAAHGLPGTTAEATGEKPSKRLRSSTIARVDVEANVSIAAPTTKPVFVAKPVTIKAIVSSADEPAPVAPTGVASISSASTIPNESDPPQKNEIFTGSFDMYSMDIEAFNIAYAPPYNADGDFDEAFYPEALYNTLIAYQSKTENNEEGEEREGPTAKLTIPIPGTNSSSLGLDDDDDDDDYNDTSDPYGTLTLSNFFHPYCGGPIEIGVTEISEQAQETLNPEIETEPGLGRPTGAWDAPGISATLEIQDYKLMSCIPEASGRFCMRPLWKGVGKGGKVMELFEGSLTFNCIFDRIWAKRAGNGVDENIVFWAVRGKN